MKEAEVRLQTRKEPSEVLLSVIYSFDDHLPKISFSFSCLDISIHPPQEKYQLNLLFRTLDLNLTRTPMSMFKLPTSYPTERLFMPLPLSVSLSTSKSTQIQRQMLSSSHIG